MSGKTKISLGVVGLAGIAAITIWRLHGVNIPVFEPRGVVGHKERNLILIALGLCAVVVIPVYTMLIGFAWKYREDNRAARYEPDFDHSRLLEALWWGVPLAIISVLAVVTWKSSHELDPFRPLASAAQPITIQAVALEWKWLFIYPQQGIASVNYLQMPVNRPVSFEVTADAPMNSLWIPQLGGQIYAMSGMSTNLHLMAAQTGKYYGSSANISGDGFAGMHFTAEATAQPSFDQWVKRAKTRPASLNLASYNQLARPSQNDPVKYYGSVQTGLYAYLVNKFITPPGFTPQENL